MKKLITILLIILCCIHADAQNPCSVSGCQPQDSLNLSSGIDNSGNVLPDSALDPFWWLINIAPPSVNGSNGISLPNAYRVTYIGSGSSTWNVIPGTGKLSVKQTAVFGTNNAVSTQPWRFRRQFCVCQAGDFKFTGIFRADDSGAVILRSSSGTMLLTMPLSPAMLYNSTSNFQANHSININSFTLAAGTYFIEVELANKNSVAMGFALKLNISSTTNTSSITNPGNSCCQVNPMISGQAMIDVNCNDSGDYGDTPGWGWNISLMNGNNVVMSAVTDTNGEYFFNNILPGTYNIIATDQAGNQVSQQTITVSQSDVVVNVLILDNSDCNSTGTCCNINGLNVGTPQYQQQQGYNGYYGRRYNIPINAGTAEIQEIRASIVSFEASYENPACAKCYVPYSTMGTFRINAAYPVINGLTTQNPGHYSMGTDLGGGNKGVREILWQGGPAVIGSITPQFEILYPKPAIEAECCKIKIKACIKFVFKDSHCNVCEKYQCIEN